MPNYTRVEALAIASGIVVAFVLLLLLLGYCFRESLRNCLHGFLLNHPHVRGLVELLPAYLQPKEDKRDKNNFRPRRQPNHPKLTCLGGSRTDVGSDDSSIIVAFAEPNLGTRRLQEVRFSGVPQLPDEAQRATTTGRITGHRRQDSFTPPYGAPVIPELTATVRRVTVADQSQPQQPLVNGPPPKSQPTEAMFERAEAAMAARWLAGLPPPTEEEFQELMILPTSPATQRRIATATVRRTDDPLPPPPPSPPQRNQTVNGSSEQELRGSAELHSFRGPHSQLIRTVEAELAAQGAAGGDWPTAEEADDQDATRRERRRSRRMQENFSPSAPSDAE